VKIKVGKAGVKPDTPSHTAGSAQRKVGSRRRERGQEPGGKSSAARSTGINPDFENPIDPSMPNLSPA
jgi:hypothetical protein